MKIKDLFDYKYGVNLELMNCQEAISGDKNAVNFVARTSINNGVVAKVKLIEGLIPQKAGTLSLAVSGSVLSCFVQKEDYYSGRDLYVLTPKTNLTLEQKLFYAMCINKNVYEEDKIGFHLSKENIFKNAKKVVGDYIAVVKVVE